MLESTYVKLLVALEKMSTEMRLDSLPNLNLRSRNSRILRCTNNIVHVVKKQIKIFSGMWPN